MLFWGGGVKIANQYKIWPKSPTYMTHLGAHKRKGRKKLVLLHVNNEGTLYSGLAHSVASQFDNLISTDCEWEPELES